MEAVNKLHTRSAKLANTYKVDIPDNIISEWQSIVDLLARIGGVRAGLIMRVQNEKIEVFLASKTSNNPYPVGHQEFLIDSGLYCEKVIRENKQLLVANALRSTEWKNNPDIKRNMISYLGFPIKLPNGNPFGTICILDDRENNFSPEIIGMVEKMRNLIEAHIELLQLSYNDPLTGLYNRTFFNMKVAEEIKRADRYKRPLAIVLMDIDDFKKVNDTYGHLAGDELLKRISRIISSCLRSLDIVARYGGEEFIVLMPETFTNGAARAAEKLRTKIENSNCLPSSEITVSIGVAERILGEPLDNWLRRADKALYRAKKSGKNRVSQA